MLFRALLGAFFGALCLAGAAWAAEETSSQDAASEEVATAEPAAAALPGDAAAGKKLYRRNCRACHGATAKGASSYPKLVGHPAAYLIDKVVRYREGEKFGPNTPLMAQRVKKLSDQDIANVTAFIISLPDD
ncbi:cytochrome c, class I [Candidatus Rhodobacter oscarellae]|uniref:Cytochrome c, class I n=1 Tax=Candidatus Rhodobacter oscarellae TaxID=1675527 RepID=A0A0J9E8C5_9RHOB|nr:cytochrome c, class I [Candidatus Rhodobacter lobularis]